MYYKIKQVSNTTGISVRMLHHYDKIELLSPARINDTGYRLYSNENLDTLQQILFFRELDFSLKEIKEIINNPTFDNIEAMTSHKNLLLKKKIRIEDIINSIDKIIKEGNTMSNKEKFESFDNSEIEEHKKKYAKEVKERYGHTDAYKESNTKTAKYSKKDWSNIMEASNSIYKQLASLMDQDPSNKQVQTIVKQLREHINKNFYNCTPEIFRGLADLYIMDERFTNFFEKFKKGFAEYINIAIIYYCDNL